MRVTLVLNGDARTLDVDTTERLCDTLRERLDLTATHVGCSEGVCGACTILLDDTPARACLALTVQCDGARVETLEGLTPADALSPAQQAFVQHGAVQCGFCTPGFLAVIEGLRRQGDAASWDEATLRRELSTVACRCTGYDGIVRAARAVLQPTP
ncbi:MAG: (2Fe-2S)-binding protein [Rhodospirillales bacterium]|nr:(2Fe-2S)-binding protein [Rhodospirillales bacterium]